MKKVTLIAAAAVVALSMASCKKTYRCDCTVAGITNKGQPVELKRSEAKDFKERCNNQQSIGGVSVSCKAVRE